MTIDIFGPWIGRHGFAQHARAFTAALAKLDQVSPVPTGVSLPNRRLADIGIGIGPISSMLKLLGRRRIGFVVWETTVIPGGMLRILLRLDELWTPSTWGRRILLENGFRGGRVHIVPEGVDPAVFQPAMQKENSGRPFRFLCVSTWQIRKGTADLVTAFAQEFAPDEPVELILHCVRPGFPDFDVDAAVREMNLPPHAPIRKSLPLPHSGLADLYRQCDVLVQPTKAEGWGLPMLEALACEVPVIATNYSAHLDFLTDANSYLVDVERMIEVDDPEHFVGGPFGVWAQPDMAHFRKLMRLSYEDSDQRLRKARQGRCDVLERWTWAHAAEIAHRRLHAMPSAFP